LEIILLLLSSKYTDIRYILSPASPKRLPASYIQLFSQLSISALPALFNSFSDTNSADLSTEPSSLDTVFPNPLPPDVAKSAIFFPAKS
jgi:hypothetical protein